MSAGVLPSRILLAVVLIVLVSAVLLSSLLLISRTATVQPAVEPKQPAPAYDMALAIDGECSPFAALNACMAAESSAEPPA